MTTALLFMSYILHTQQCPAFRQPPHPNTNCTLPTGLFPVSEPPPCSAPAPASWQWTSQPFPAAWPRQRHLAQVTSLWVPCLPARLSHGLPEGVCSHCPCLCAGLMDVGAGAFVFSGALTSRPPALQPVRPRSVLHRASRGVLPLCSLGEAMLCCCRPLHAVTSSQP